jgi:hypothetical protein
MIEPEIAFADLSDNAALAEALLKYTFAALLNERQEDLAFFDHREGAGRETRGDRRFGIRAYGLRRGDRSARARTRGSPPTGGRLAEDGTTAVGCPGISRDPSTRCSCSPESSREVPHGPPLSHHRAYGSRTTAVSLRVQRRMADREIDQSLPCEPSDVHGNLRLRRVGQAPPPSA